MFPPVNLTFCALAPTPTFPFMSHTETHWTHICSFQLNSQTLIIGQIAWHLCLWLSQPYPTSTVCICSIFVALSFEVTCALRGYSTKVRVINNHSLYFLLVLSSYGSYYIALFFRLPTPSSDGQRHCLRISQQAGGKCGTTGMTGRVGLLRCELDAAPGCRRERQQQTERNARSTRTHRTLAPAKNDWMQVLRCVSGNVVG